MRATRVWCTGACLGAGSAIAPTPPFALGVCTPTSKELIHPLHSAQGHIMENIYSIASSGGAAVTHSVQGRVDKRAGAADVRTSRSIRARPMAVHVS